MKLVVIKVAAIGDVALTSQALLDYLCKYSPKPEVHWIIDENLAPLAKTLLSRWGITEVEFHHVSAKKLFQGSVVSKIKEVLKIVRYLKKIKASGVCLMHRDWRYSAVIRSSYMGPLIRLSKASLHEVDSYRIALARVAQRMGQVEASIKSRFIETSLDSTSPSGIGLLLGGGGSAKITYQEKTYPHWEKLLELLINKLKGEKITLFGDAEDLKKYSSIIEKLDKKIVNNLINAISLQEIPEHLAKLRIFISIDTGLAHIAATIMKHPSQKVITLFGPTDPNLWRPTNLFNRPSQIKLIRTNLACSPCYKNDGNFKTCIFKGQDFQKCMHLITPEEILNHIS